MLAVTFYKNKFKNNTNRKGEEHMGTTEKGAILLYRNETPLHVGSGSEMGIIDLPIQREKHTGFPKMEGSGIKGTFKDYFSSNLPEEILNEILQESLEENGDKLVDKLFGKEEMKANDEGDENVSSQAGGLIFTDAKLLLFPVKSKGSVFRWITCPYALQRFARELKRVGKSNESNEIEDLLKEYNDNKLDNECMYIVNQKKENINENNNNRKITLEEIVLEVKIESYEKIIKTLNFIKRVMEGTYLKEKLNNNIVIVSDEIFGYFTEMSTQVDTRIRIGEDGVVKKGGLFTEESLPEECILYSVVEEWKDSSLNGFKKGFSFKGGSEESIWLQFGGSKTVGKGLTQVSIIE